MLKEIIFIASAISLVVGLCIFSQWHTMSQAENISELLTQVETAVDNDDWQQAKELLEQAKQKWQKTQKVWRALISHSDMKGVEMGFVDIETILNQQNTDKAQQELAMLIFFIDHVPENEALTLQNLL